MKSEYEIKKLEKLLFIYDYCEKKWGSDWTVNGLRFNDRYDEAEKVYLNQDKKES